MGPEGIRQITGHLRGFPAVVEGDEGEGRARPGQPVARPRSAIATDGRNGPRPGTGRERAVIAEDVRAVGEAAATGAGDQRGVRWVDRLAAEPGRGQVPPRVVHGVA